MRVIKESIYICFHKTYTLNHIKNLNKVSRVSLMSSRQKAALVTNTSNRCSCCINCKSRISRLQIMVNELFSYISDYLPEQLQEFHHQPPPPPPQIVLAPIQTQNLTKKHAPMIQRIATKKVQKPIIKKTMSNVPVYKQLKILPTPNDKKLQGRKKFTFKQKMIIVAAVQDAVQRGEKISDACAKQNICDRSYQRWKKLYELGIEEMSSGQEQELVIQDPQN